MKKILLSAILLAAPCHAASLTGLWLFDDSANLGKATVGNDLAFAGTAPGAFSPSLADDAANSQTGVITTPAAAAATRFTATHGIAANGGGAYVNQYTILVDLFSPAGSRGSWRTIMQTSQTNANDGDYFINPGNLVGVGELTYSTSVMEAGQWTRLVISFDLGTGINAYTNGGLLKVHSAGSVDGRFSLDPTVHFFTDEDGDNAPLNIGALAIFDGALTSKEVAALGLPGAPIPEPSGLLLAGGAALGMLRRRRA